MALLIMLFSSCSKNSLGEPDNAPEETPSQQEVIGDRPVEKAASVIAQMNMTQEVVSQIKEEIEASLNDGRDEVITLNELLNGRQDEGRVRSSASCESFSTLFRETLNSDLLRSTEATEIKEKDLVDAGVNIYWPYSEDWDGHSLPVIAISPEDETNEWCTAYVLKKKNNHFVCDGTIQVNEEYAKKHPVWVVNITEEPLGNKDYIFPLEKLDSDITKQNVNMNDLRSADNKGKKIKTVYLGSLRSTKQHDPWYKGGSEYFIEVSSPKLTLTDGKVVKTDDNVKKCVVEFTRKEISKGVTKTFGFGTPIVTEWQDELNEIAFLMYENDTSVFKESVNISLSATWNSKTYGLSVKLPFGSGDDMIDKTTYTRNFLFSTNNYEQDVWNTYYSNGVYWTLPFKVGTVLL